MVYFFTLNNVRFPTPIPFPPIKSSIAIKFHVLLFLMQLWAHAYRESFHGGINTNNITESLYCGRGIFH